MFPRCDDLGAFDRWHTLSRLTVQPPGNPRPVARTLHSLHVVDPTTPGGKLLVYGGKDSTTVFDDLWLFDPDTENWEEIIVTPRPDGREAAATAVAAGAMWLHGGV